MPLSEIAVATGGIAGILLLAVLALTPWLARHAQAGTVPRPEPARDR